MARWLIFGAAKQFTTMNRTILSTLVLGLLSFGVLAQRTAGTLALGGGFNVRSTKNEAGANNTITTTNVSLLPNVGYFIADNFAIGMELSLSAFTTESNNQSSRGTAYNIGPAARYYKQVGATPLTIFGQAGIYFGGGRNEVTTGTVTTELKSSSFGIYVNPGFAYFFNEHWAGELYFNGISYSGMDPNKDANADKSSTVSFGLNSLAPTGLGVRYHF